MTKYQRESYLDFLIFIETENDKNSEALRKKIKSINLNFSHVYLIALNVEGTCNLFGAIKRQINVYFLINSPNYMSEFSCKIKR